MHGDKKHLGPRLADKQHQGHRERDQPTPGHHEDTDGTQVVCPPSHHLQVHSAPEWTDDRATIVPTPAVLCHHSEQVARSDAFLT